MSSDISMSVNTKQCLGCSCPLSKEEEKLGLCSKCRKKLLADIHALRAAEETGGRIHVEDLRILPGIQRRPK